MSRTHGTYNTANSYDGSQNDHTSEHIPGSAGDPSLAQHDLHAHDALKEIQRLLALGSGRIQPVLPTPTPLDYTGDTPIAGTGAVARWVALHDRARDLR